MRQTLLFNKHQYLVFLVVFYVRKKLYEAISNIHGLFVKQFLSANMTNRKLGVNKTK